MGTTDVKTAILRPDLKWAISRFPFALLAASLLTLWALVYEFKRAIARRYVELPEEQVIFMLLLAFLVATAAAFTTLRLRPWVGLATQAAGYLLGLGLGYALQATPYTVTPLFLSLICFIALGAGHATKGGMIGAWLSALSLAANFALCLVALGIILGGGAIIIASIETLLGIETGEALELLAIIASLIGVPLFWLSLSRFCEDEPAGEQPVNLLHRVVSVVTDGLLIPLMLIFAGVIHLYAGRIALMLELPKGQIGWIVPTYLLIGYGVYLLAHTPGTLLPRLRRVFLRAWIFATLVPLVLLGIAVGMRIDAYGITEERYHLALIVLGSALAAASVLVRRPLDLRVLPLTGGVLALIAAFGPLSAHNVTVYSQAARARAIVSSVPPERWAQSRDGSLREQQKQELVSAVRELEERKVNLKEVFPPDAWPKQLPLDSWKLAKELNTTVTSETYKSTHLSFDNAQVARLGSVILIDGSYINWESAAPQIRQSGDLNYVLQIKGTILEVSGENSTARFDLSALLTLEDKPKGDNPRPVFQSLGDRKGELIVEEFSRRHHATGSELMTVSAQIALY